MFPDHEAPAQMKRAIAVRSFSEMASAWEGVTNSFGNEVFWDG